MRRKLTYRQLPAIVTLILIASCSIRPDRFAYKSIGAATSAVQGYVAVFKSEPHTPEAEAKMRDAYAKYQAVATAAVEMSQKATDPNAPDILQLVNGAVAQFLTVHRIWHPEAK